MSSISIPNEIMIPPINILIISSPMWDAVLGCNSFLIVIKINFPKTMINRPPFSIKCVKRN